MHLQKVVFAGAVLEYVYTRSFPSFKSSFLATDPLAPSNNVKKFQGREGYRLSLGDWRNTQRLMADAEMLADVRDLGSSAESVCATSSLAQGNRRNLIPP